MPRVLLFRWLLPVFTVLSLLGGAVTTYAASGVIGESECCCPSPDTCRCHDHDGGPRPGPEMKKCSGSAQQVAPQVTPAILPVMPVTTEAVMVGALEHATAPMPGPRSERPETPPF